MLKTFELPARAGHGLRTFLKEIELHVRLQHPLVVPLVCAFVDFDNQRGFLHFNKYPFDLSRLAHGDGQLADHDVIPGSGIK